MIRLALLAVMLALASGPAKSHDIYTGLRGSFGNICCSGSGPNPDCTLTTYREAGGDFDFLTREGHWVRIPVERIMFIAIPGEPPHPDSHAAHLCYGSVMGYERADDGSLFSGDGQTIHLFCAFIPPGAI